MGRLAFEAITLADVLLLPIDESLLIDICVLKLWGDGSYKKRGNLPFPNGERVSSRVQIIWAEDDFLNNYVSIFPKLNKT